MTEQMPNNMEQCKGCGGWAVSTKGVCIYCRDKKVDQRYELTPHQTKAVENAITENMGNDPNLIVSKMIEATVFPSKYADEPT